jgi:peptide/nickel transport system substrate-binding protein
VKKVLLATISVLLILAGVLTSCKATPTTTTSNVTTSMQTTSNTTIKPTTATSTSTATATTTTTTPTATGPKYGGTFTMGMTFGPSYFDAALLMPFYAYSMFLTNEDLLIGDWAKGPAGTNESDWVLNMMPMLNITRGCIAESWQISEPDTVTFNIRKGIHFFNKAPVNGRELDASDVVFSINRIFTIPSSYHAIAYGKSLASVTATDKWTVVVKFASGQFNRTFEMLANWLHIVPKELVVDSKGIMVDWKNSIGTGAFMLTDYVPGQALTYVRNPNYWDTDPIGLGKGNQLPYLDRVKQLIITDPSTRLAAMRVGKVDWLGDFFNPIQWDTAKSLMSTNPELKSKQYSMEMTKAIGFRTDKKPFDDIRVRRAMQLAVDKKAIATNFYGGYADMIIWPVGPDPSFADMRVDIKDLPAETQELFGYYPDKAQKLLADAGYTNGFSFNLPCRQGDVDVLTIILAYWEKVGIKAKLQVTEEVAMQAIQANKSHETAFTWVVEGAQSFKFLWERPGATYNTAMVNDPKMNEYIAKIDAITTYQAPAARVIMKEAFAYELSQAWYLQVPGPQVFTFWQPWVNNYHGELMLGKAKIYDFPKYIWIDTNMKGIR